MRDKIKKLIKENRGNILGVLIIVVIISITITGYYVMFKTVFEFCDSLDSGSKEDTINTVCVCDCVANTSTEYNR